MVWRPCWVNGAFLWNYNTESDVALTDMFGCEDAIHTFYAAEYKRKQALAERRSLTTARKQENLLGENNRKREDQNQINNIKQQPFDLHILEARLLDRLV